MQIRIVNSSTNPLPAYETAGAAGMDIRAHLAHEVAVAAGARVLIPTGLFIELPEGYEAQIRPRSGLALRHGITLPNAPATIDSDYRGELQIPIINLGQESFTIHNGDRIAQMVIARYERADWIDSDSLTETARGEGGFGHTGL